MVQSLHQDLILWPEPLFVKLAKPSEETSELVKVTAFPFTYKDSKGEPWDS